MGVLRITAGWGITATMVMKQLQIENETWVIDQTRTGKATLYTLLDADMSVMIDTLNALWDTGLVDECRYEHGLHPTITKFRLRRVWWRRIAMAILEPFLRS